VSNERSTNPLFGVKDWKAQVFQQALKERVSKPAKGGGGDGWAKPIRAADKGPYTRN
jgi:hypothetical protein